MAGIINDKKKNFFKGNGAPWEIKGHKGAPWWQKGAAPSKKA
jgi:hypothetical protein